MPKITNNDPLDLRSMPDGSSRAHIVSIRLRRVLDEDLRAVLAANGGITIPTWRILSVLSDDGCTLSQKEVCARSRIAQGQASRTLFTMQENGLLDVAQSLVDRRAWNYSLSAAGRTLHARLIVKLRVRRDALDGAVSAQELAIYEKVAVQIAKKAQERHVLQIDQGHLG